MKAKIIIKLNDDGSVIINAPSDKILTCGMLELAKYAIVDKDPERKVIPIDFILKKE